MRSPFPGMDPYLEHPTIWQDLHQDLASEIRHQISRHLRPRYYARITPRVIYDTVEIGARSIIPDVGVYTATIAPRTARETALTLTPPVENFVELEIEVKQFAIQIRTAENQLVTVIELLSPVNKRRGQKSYDDYLRKRRELLRTRVHLMEIDLLREGERPPFVKPLPPAPYFVFLSRGDRRPSAQVWPIRFQDTLPVVPIPLLEPDPDVALDLSAVLNEIYERAAYELQIDYKQPPPKPALSAEDEKWLDARLHEQGLR